MLLHTTVVTVGLGIFFRIDTNPLVSLRHHREDVLADERILGSGDFVERVIREADERLKRQVQAGESREKVEQFIQGVCDRERINAKELRAGSRREHISRVRSRVAVELVENYGIPLAEVARELGVSTSAISKILTRVHSK